MKEIVISGKGGTGKTSVLAFFGPTVHTRLGIAAEGLPRSSISGIWGFQGGSA